MAHKEYGGRMAALRKMSGGGGGVADKMAGMMKSEPPVEGGEDLGEAPGLPEGDAGLVSSVKGLLSNPEFAGRLKELVAEFEGGGEEEAVEEAAPAPRETPEEGMGL